MNELSYTIIIPHYNRLGVLQRALDSIPKREDIQIIVVDDASTNIALNEWMAFENINTNVEFIFNKVNKGPGVARNTAIKSNIRGKWILFLDADDSYTKDTFSVLDCYVDSSYDVIYFNANKVDSATGNTRSHERLSKLINYALIDGSEVNALKYRLTAPWNKMVKTDLIKKYNIGFDNTYFGEDAIYSVMVGYFSTNIHIIYDEIYNYYISLEGLGKKSNMPSFSWHKQDLQRRIAYQKFLNTVCEDKYHYSIFKLIKSNIITRWLESKDRHYGFLIYLMSLLYVLLNPFIDKNYINHRIQQSYVLHE